MMTFIEIVSAADNLAAQYKIELPYDLRKKSRFKTQSCCGVEVGLILPRGHILRNGTFVRSDAGDMAIILAANETVSTASTNDSVLLAKAAYHLGNRHVSLQVTEKWIRYLHDHVLDEMVKGLGLKVTVENASFEPEAGAYGGGHKHGDDHHQSSCSP